jgi:predicted dehydrogenase
VNTATSPLKTTDDVSTRPLRLGFAGVGWIGLNRLQAVSALEFVTPAAVFDPCAEAVAKARDAAPDATVVPSFEELLDHDLDAVVIATPSALHAEQSIAALERGIAVFCQKPLARTTEETIAVIEAARSADRLLMTDLSYRYIRGVDRMRQLIRDGGIGDVFAIDLAFHNAYGPDKAWFFDYARAGGGCLIDLGTHLVDLAIHLVGARSVAGLESRLFRQGRQLETPIGEVEDFASVTWDFENGPTVRLACSWNVSAGRDAVIEAVCYGSRGGVALRNENGSFFDFSTEQYRGTAREPLAEQDRGWGWGGGAIRDFATRLARGASYDRECETLIDVATILDRSYGR